MSSLKSVPNVSQPSPLPTNNVEAMFQQIMHAVNKSHREISELKQECVELRLANASLERQVREGLQYNMYNLRNGTPGFITPAPPSPQLRPKLSPFLSLSPQIPHITTPVAESTYYRPSPLGDNSLTPLPYDNRDIPGFYVVIPAGGAGTRLWPLSREEHPKFLLTLP